MNEQIGKIFTVGKADYKVVSAKPFDPEHKNMIRLAEETGKYPAYFWFAKILRNGEVSKKQGFYALMFKSGNFVRLHF